MAAKEEPIGTNADPKPDPKEWGHVGLYFTTAVTTIVNGIANRDHGMIASGIAGATAGGAVIVGGLVDACSETIKFIAEVKRRALKGS